MVQDDDPSRPSSVISDLTGLKHFGKAADRVTEFTVDIFGRILRPSADELGEALRQKFKNWLLTPGAPQIASKTVEFLQQEPGSENWHPHPRVGVRLLEAGSWIESDEVQDLWAGLLASSCTADGRDESNLMFVNLLAQLTHSQARMLNYAGANAPRHFTDAGLINPRVGSLLVHLDQLVEISGISDLNRLDRELDHLRALGLFAGGMMIDSPLYVDDKPVAADLRPTPMGFDMYVRCHGWRGATSSFPGWLKPAEQADRDVSL